MTENQQDSPIDAPRLASPLKVPKPGDERIEELRLAIQNLEKFTAFNSDVAVPHVLNLDIAHGKIVSRESTLTENAVDLARCFVTALLSDEIRERYEKKRDTLQSEILKAIEIIKANYLILDKLKEGDEGEQKLAEMAIKAINQFNAMQEHAALENPGLGTRLARFLFRKSGLSIDEKLRGKTIELPLPIFSLAQSPRLAVPKYISRRVRQELSDPSALAAQKKITTLEKHFRPEGTPCKPTRREVDAFRVKAITMIRDYGFRTTSLKEALAALRSSPIQTTMDHESDESSSIVKFVQELQPFPGEVLVLEGAFRRDAESMVKSIPIPESFRLFTKSEQTGFPHPLQYCGYAFSDKMIPPFPHVPESIPHFHAMQRAMRGYAHYLLPNGGGLTQAKELLGLKKKVFQRYASHFVNLHLAFAEAFLEEALSIPKQKKATDVLSAFFESVGYQKEAYVYLGATYQTLVDLFVNKPYEALQNSWVAESSPQLFDPNKERRYRAAVRIFYKGIRESEREVAVFRESGILTQLTPYALDFISLVGPYLARSACVIFLQALSEKIIYNPPILSQFDQTVQELLYRQLQFFLEEKELELPKGEDEKMQFMKERLVKAIEGDIELLRDPGSKHTEVPHLIVRELETYYCDRCG